MTLTNAQRLGLIVGAAALVLTTLFPPMYITAEHGRAGGHRIGFILGLSEDALRYTVNTPLLMVEILVIVLATGLITAALSRR